MNIVLDTNVLVSAMLSPGRKAYSILQSVIFGDFQIVFDARIMDEYEKVLHYRKFGFKENDIAAVLSPIMEYGLQIVAHPLTDIAFNDESDRKFLEVAKTAEAVLITGNMKHFPEDPIIMNVSDFHSRFIASSSSV